MIPDFVHPVLKKTVGQLLAQLDPSPTMCKVLPFPQYPFRVSDGDISPPTATYWSFPLPHPTHERRKEKKTRVMAIVNATPDSFSDGSQHNTVPAALAYARHAVVHAGATIVDVGGCSTRPSAEEVSAEEEMARVLPIVRALREDEEVGKVMISVDTFREEVARAAILQAGANCINDVYAFTGPQSFPLCEEGWERLKGMRALARETCVAVILMHSRGPAAGNKSYDVYPGGVIEGVARELGEKVRMVVEGAGGVRRWCVMVDPGIGFSKTVQDNLRLLNRIAEVRVYSGLLEGYPVVLGPSRKSFLGALLKSGERGRDTVPRERGYATAAAVACAVMEGVEVVRVHDVLEMADVVRVTEMICSEGEE
jgi:dihydroneopterin aldolase / 2-amino-4-hydroxy-6-hydroxymethyldihydropteridine diphosphokinase / dihydropteroate synthase